MSYDIYHQKAMDGGNPHIQKKVCYEYSDIKTPTFCFKHFLIIFKVLKHALLDIAPELMQPNIDAIREIPHKCH